MAGPILLVHDDIAAIAAVRRLLSREGREVVLATSAADAVIGFGHHLPELMILAPTVEGGRGRVVVEELALHPDAASLRLLLLGEPLEGVAARVVPLPLDGAQFLETFHAALGDAPGLGTSASPEAHPNPGLEQSLFGDLPQLESNWEMAAMSTEELERYMLQQEREQAARANLEAVVEQTHAEVEAEAMASLESVWGEPTAEQREAESRPPLEPVVDDEELRRLEEEVRAEAARRRELRAKASTSVEQAPVATAPIDPELDFGGLADAEPELPSLLDQDERAALLEIRRQQEAAAAAELAPASGQEPDPGREGSSFTELEPDAGVSHGNEDLGFVDPLDVREAHGLDVGVESVQALSVHVEEAPLPVDSWQLDSPGFGEGEPDSEPIASADPGTMHSEARADDQGGFTEAPAEFEAEAPHAEAEQLAAEELAANDAEQPAQAERLAAEELAAHEAEQRAEAERLAAEELAAHEAEQLAEAERLAAEELAAHEAEQRAEAERLAAEELAANEAEERAEAERLAAEELAAREAEERAEAERLAAEELAAHEAEERAEAERLAAEELAAREAEGRAEAERLAAQVGAAKHIGGPSSSGAEWAEDDALDLAFAPSEEESVPAPEELETDLDLTGSDEGSFAPQSDATMGEASTGFDLTGADDGPSDSDVGASLADASAAFDPTGEDEAPMASESDVSLGDPSAEFDLTGADEGPFAQEKHASLADASALDLTGEDEEPLEAEGAEEGSDGLDLTGSDEASTELDPEPSRTQVNSSDRATEQAVARAEALRRAAEEQAERALEATAEENADPTLGDEDADPAVTDAATAHVLRLVERAKEEGGELAPSTDPEIARELEAARARAERLAAEHAEQSREEHAELERLARERESAERAARTEREARERLTRELAASREASERARRETEEAQQLAERERQQRTAEERARLEAEAETERARAEAKALVLPPLSGALRQVPRHGSLSLSELAALVQRLSRAEAPLKLELRGDEAVRTLYFDGGAIVSATSSVSAESLLSRARRDGLIDSAQESELRLVRALASSELLEVMQGRGYLRPSEAIPLLQRQIEQIALEALSEPRSDYRLVETAPPPELPRVTPPRSTLQLLTEAVKRGADASAEGLGGLLAIPSFADPHVDLSPFGFAEREKRLLRQIDGETGVGALLLRAGIRQELGLRTLEAARQLGLLAIRYPPAAREDALPDAELKRLEAKFLEVQVADYFSVLGLSRTAGSDEVLRAYELLSTEFHPLRFAAHPDPSIQLRAQQVHDFLIEASEALADDRLRASYARSLVD